MSKNIPVNKGNYSLDIPEREQSFEARRAAKQPEAYAKYRSDWNTRPLEMDPGEYPVHVDIELASLCNLSCPMCYTITDEFIEKVNAKLMDFELFKKIIDDIAGKVPSIRLSYRGESTLHPKFIECIKYAKDAGIVEVSTLTNGSKLKKRE